LAAALAAVVLLAAAPLPAQDWAKDMFSHLSHDFGTIARGAKAEHRFPLQNVFVEGAHIVSVTSSCGCTQPEATKTFLRTWETADIVARIDTRSNIGHREASITVKFDKPFPAEVILKVSCFIRGDVVVQPGVIQLGSVPQGTKAQQKVEITYAGRSDWRLESIETSNPNYAINAHETSRTAGQVSYELLFELKPTTPAGYIKDEVYLITNDLSRQTARVPVPVEGVVVPSITMRPAPLIFGLVASGQSSTKHLVVQGQKAFKVLKVECDDPRLTLAAPSAASAVHVIPVTFTAGSLLGTANPTIHISTEGGTLEVQVQVRVVACENGAAPHKGASASAAPGANVALRAAAAMATNGLSDGQPGFAPAVALASPTKLVRPGGQDSSIVTTGGMLPRSPRGSKGGASAPMAASGAGPYQGGLADGAPALLPAGSGARPARSLNPLPKPTPARAPTTSDVDPATGPLLVAPTGATRASLPVAK